MRKKFFTYAVAVVFTTVVCFGRLYYMRPFGLGVLLGSLAFLHPLPLILAYVGGSVGANPTLGGLIETACELTAIAVCLLVLRKRKVRLWYIVLAAAVGKFGCAYRVVVDGTNVYTEILSFGFAALTALVTQTALNPTLGQKFKYRLTETETAAFAALGIIWGLSLSAFTFFGFDPAVSIAVCLTVLAAYVSGVGAAFTVATAMGCGIALHTFEVGVFAALVAMAGLAALFRNAPRVLGASAALMGLITAVFSFGSGDMMTVAAAAVGATLAVAVPSRAVKYAKNVLSSGDRPALRYMINRFRSDVGGRLTETSRLIGDMANVLNVEPPAPTSSAGILRARACANCVDRARCGVTDAAVDAYLSGAIKSGRTGVSALPQAFADGCTHLSTVVREAGEIVAEEVRINDERARAAETRRTVAEHLLGVKEILRDMGEREARPVGLDPALERKLIEELTYRNVVCGEALLEDTDCVTRGTLVVRLDCIDTATISKVASKVLKSRVKVAGVSDSNLSGWGIVYLESCPRLDALFAVASATKAGSTASGDTHSFVKVTPSRFMMALSDGMGSGESARLLSENAVTLVESFYKAGYPCDLILKSVNRFLSDTSDGFSAVDIAVIDLDEGTSDLIKIGAPPSYIKDSETVTVVRGKALPLGIVEEMRPFVVRRAVKVGEVAVFVSDGVSDCFEGDSLADFINRLPPYNPQTIVNEILDEALRLSGGVARDDMTAIAARIFERV